MAFFSALHVSTIIAWRLQHFAMIVSTMSSGVRFTCLQQGQAKVQPI